MATIYYPPTQNGLQKTLAAQLNQGVTAQMTLNNTTGLQNKPGVCVVDRIDTAGNEKDTVYREYISYTGISGNNLTGLTRGLGGSTDQDHLVGAVVEFIPDVTVFQGLIDSFTTEHNQDGTHNTSYVVTPTATQTLTNKTLTSPVINTSISGTAKAIGTEVNTGTEDTKIVTPKAIGDSNVVFTDKTQTLSNKTLTSPVINTSISGTAIATGTEVNTGTDNTKIVTPKAMGDSSFVITSTSGSGKKIYILSTVLTLTGGAATEVVNIALPSGFFSAKPNMGLVMDSTRQTIVGFYDYDNAGNSATNAVVVLRDVQGANIGSGGIRLNCLFGGN